MSFEKVRTDVAERAGASWGTTRLDLVGPRHRRGEGTDLCCDEEGDSTMGLSKDLGAEEERVQELIAKRREASAEERRAKEDRSRRVDEQD